MDLSLTCTASLPSRRRATAIVGDRFSSIRSFGGFTRAAQARVGAGEHAREVDVVLRQVRVVLQNRGLLARGKAADVTDGEARPDEHRLATEDLRIGDHSP